MKINRPQLLKITAGVAILFLGLDHWIITPLLSSWNERETNIALLHEKIEKGSQVLSRKKVIQDRWTEIKTRNLAKDSSLAEETVFKQISQWVRKSHTVCTSLTPQWQNHDQGYKTLEMRAHLTGDQLSLCQFLYEMETDSLPIRLEDCSFNAHDDQGQELSLTVRFTALQLSLPEGGTQ